MHNNCTLEHQCTTPQASAWAVQTTTCTTSTASGSTSQTSKQETTSSRRYFFILLPTFYLCLLMTIIQVIPSTSTNTLPSFQSFSLSSTQIHINPNYRIAELDFNNNAVTCNFEYTGVEARASNCRVGRG